MPEVVQDIKTRTFKFSLMIFKLVKSIQFDSTFRFLINQLLRSSTSIGANVMEGKSSSSRKEMARYYQIALKSANETSYWLMLLRDGLEVNSDLLKSVFQELDQLSKILGKSIITLKSQTNG